MDILVRLEDGPPDPLVLANVTVLPSLPFGPRERRDVVTIYGEPNAESLALGVAAAVGSVQAGEPLVGVARHIDVWSDRGAVGDTAWRDGSGTLVSRDVSISFAQLHANAVALLDEHGSAMRRAAVGLAATDWPDGVERTVNFSLTPRTPVMASGSWRQIEAGGAEAWLESMRVADAFAFVDSDDE